MKTIFFARAAAVGAVMLIAQASQAAIITNGPLTANIRADNGAIHSAGYNEEFFRLGAHVSDWGLRVGGSFDRATANGGPVGAFGSLTGPIGGVISGTGAFAGIGYQRDYSIMTGIDVLRTTTTLTNTSGGTLNVVLFETYDPDQGPGSATDNDVLLINGVLAAQSSNPRTSILGSLDTPAALGFSGPGSFFGLGIGNNSELGSFLTSGGFDPNGAHQDIGNAIAFTASLGAGETASFTTLHAFGDTIAEAQAAFTAATTITEVSEPGTLALFGLSLAGLAAVRRKKAA